MDARLSAVLCITIVLVTIIFLRIIINKIKKEFEILVSETSRRYLELCAINRRYLFHSNLKKHYEFPHYANSKQQYDRFRFDSFFQNVIEEQGKELFAIAEDVRENQILYEQYCMAKENLSPYTSKEEARKHGLPLRWYGKIERRIVSAQEIKPVTDTRFVCIVHYISPQGRNHYRTTREYTVQELFFHHQELIKAKEIRKTAQFQRKLVTPALRYKILTRDGHRCTICGRGAEHGVTLHVDHIIPISKGGLTVEKNLRTLCHECNMGKGDKYDPFGVN